VPGSLCWSAMRAKGRSNVAPNKVSWVPFLCDWPSQQTDLSVVGSYNVHVDIIDEAYLLIFTQYLAIRLGWRKFYWWKYGPSSRRYFLRTAMLQAMPLHFHLIIGMKLMLPQWCCMKLVQSLGTPLRPGRAKYEQVLPFHITLTKLMWFTGPRRHPTCSHDPYEEIHHVIVSCLPSLYTWFRAFSLLVCCFDGVTLKVISWC
jgi:hypothetical protein